MFDKKLGILLFRKIIKENDLYVKILLSNDQIVTGIVYGGNSSKKKNIYQIGYILNVNFSKRNINGPYLITSEISTPLLGSLLNDKYKLYCLLSIISLLNFSIIEGQKINGIFKFYNNFIDQLLINKKWIRYYCVWLFDLLKIIGYEIDYKSNLDKNYFDVETFDFINYKNKNSYYFPHKFLQGKENIKYSYINDISLIFEHLFINNHLINTNNKLPSNYINFKKLILNFLYKKHKND